VTHETCTAVVR